MEAMGCLAGMGGDLIQAGVSSRIQLPSILSPLITEAFWGEGAHVSPRGAPSLLCLRASESEQMPRVATDIS